MNLCLAFESFGDGDGFAADFEDLDLIFFLNPAADVFGLELILGKGEFEFVFLPSILFELVVKGLEFGFALADLGFVDGALLEELAGFLLVGVLLAGKGLELLSAVGKGVLALGLFGENGLGLAAVLGDGLGKLFQALFEGLLLIGKSSKGFLSGGKVDFGLGKLFIGLVALAAGLFELLGEVLERAFGVRGFGLKAFGIRGQLASLGKGFLLLAGKGLKFKEDGLNFLAEQGLGIADGGVLAFGSGKRDFGGFEIGLGLLQLGLQGSLLSCEFFFLESFLVDGFLKLAFGLA